MDLGPSAHHLHGMIPDFWRKSSLPMAKTNCSYFVYETWTSGSHALPFQALRIALRPSLGKHQEKVLAVEKVTVVMLLYLDQIRAP
jgi:hypothetical protein